MSIFDEHQTLVTRVKAYLHQAWARRELKKRACDAGDFQQTKNNVFGTSLRNKICEQRIGIRLGASFR